MPDIFDKQNGLFVSIPATSPLRESKDVDAAIERYRGGGLDIVFGVTPSHGNPSLNMVSVNHEGYLEIAMPSSTGLFPRQDVKPLFDVTTAVYVSAAPYILACDSLMQGRVGGVEIPVERSLDIDTEYDLHLADVLLKTPFKPALKD